MTKVDNMFETVYEQAREEIRKEDFRNAVDAEKARLRTHRPLWKRLFPYRVHFERLK